MNISPLSFGKKIPIVKCQIQEKDSGKFIPATVYEVDCADEEDVIEIKNLSRRWTFKDWISHNMDIKHSIKEYFGSDSCTMSFYQIRDNDGDLVGISQTNEADGTCELNYIDTKPRNQYKFAGQTLLAAIGKKILAGNGNQFVIRTAIDDAESFYEKTCGFERIGKDLFRMDREQLKTFISQTEERTQSPLISIKE